MSFNKFFLFLVIFFSLGLSLTVLAFNPTLKCEKEKCQINLGGMGESSVKKKVVVYKAVPVFQSVIEGQTVEFPSSAVKPGERIIVEVDGVSSGLMNVEFSGLKETTITTKDMMGKANVISAAISCENWDEFIAAANMMCEKLKAELIKHNIVLKWKVLPGGEFNAELKKNELREHDIFFYLPGTSGYPVFEELRPEFNWYSKDNKKTHSVLHIQLTCGLGGPNSWKVDPKTKFPSGYFIGMKDEKLTNYMLPFEEGIVKENPDFYNDQFDRFVKDLVWFAAEKKQLQK